MLLYYYYNFIYSLLILLIYKCNNIRVEYKLDTLKLYIYLNILSI